MHTQACRPQLPSTTHVFPPLRIADRRRGDGDPGGRNDWRVGADRLRAGRGINEGGMFWLEYHIVVPLRSRRPLCWFASPLPYNGPSDAQHSQLMLPAHPPLNPHSPQALPRHAPFSRSTSARPGGAATASRRRRTPPPPPCAQMRLVRRPARHEAHWRRHRLCRRVL